MQHRTTSDVAGDWDTYYYEKNLQGDVIAIYNASGTKLVSYTYDAWGNFTRTDIASSVPDVVKNNPITYRGYYYDHDLDLYYLTTRYYDPETYRFVTADDPAYLGANGDLISYNLYAYCSNNPVMYIDPTGHWIDTVFDLFSLGFSVVEVVINPMDPWAWAGLGGDALDLIPFVSGLGEGIKGMKVVAKGVDLADDALDTIKFAKAVDFTDDALDTIKSLDRVGDFTKSTRIKGIKIHTGYKTFDKAAKEFKDVPGIRPDFFNGSTVFELKPYNRNSLRLGVAQLIKYKNKLGQQCQMFLEFY